MTDHRKIIAELVSHLQKQLRLAEDSLQNENEIQATSAFRAACEKFLLTIQPITDSPLGVSEKPNVISVAAQPIRVLVIDDDEDIHRMLRYILPKQGFTLVSELNPEVAIQRISEIKPNVVLLDLMMPQISGFETIKLLGESPERTNFKIIVGSSRSYDTDRVAALKAGANDFIAKPYNIQELLLRLRQLAA